MAAYEYDPELPFAVVEDGQVMARFRNRADADYWVQDVTGDGEVIDTAPKPKIPEDAQYITWQDFEDGTTFAYRERDGWIARHLNNEFDAFYPGEDILESIGDAEVTVLVAKED
jgi:hypothetical protein